MVQATQRRDPGHVEEDGLKGMETDKAIAFVRIDHEKENPGDDTGKIRQRAGRVCLETCIGGGRRRHCLGSHGTFGAKGGAVCKGGSA